MAQLRPLPRPVTAVSSRVSGADALPVNTLSCGSVAVHRRRCRAHTGCVLLLVVDVPSLDTWMLPLSRQLLNAAVLSSKPVLTLFGDGFTVWKWHAAAAKAALLRGDIAGMEAANTALQQASAVHSHTPAGGSGSDAPVEVPSPSKHAATKIVTVKRMEHQNFTDIALFGPVGVTGRGFIAVELFGVRLAVTDTSCGVAATLCPAGCQVGRLAKVVGRIRGDVGLKAINAYVQCRAVPCCVGGASV